MKIFSINVVENSDVHSKIVKPHTSRKALLDICYFIHIQIKQYMHKYGDITSQ